MTDPYAALRQALEALEAVEPHSEAVMCYASTINEWPANAIPAQLNRAITAARAALEAQPELRGEVVVTKSGGQIVAVTRQDAAITALRAAIAEVEKVEPVAWIDNSGHPRHISYLQSATERRLYGPLRPLFAVPPQRKDTP